MASPTLTPTEAALIDTVRVALMSSPGSMRQHVQRMVKNPPTDLHRVELQAQLSSLLASAPPDTTSPLRRSMPAEGLPAPLPPAPTQRRRGGRRLLQDDGRGPATLDAMTSDDGVTDLGASVVDDAPGEALSILASGASPDPEGAPRSHAENDATGRTGRLGRSATAGRAKTVQPDIAPFEGLAPEPVWSKNTATSVKDLIRQQLHAGLLADHGLAPASKVMFVGPPGVGKTMTALYLAHQLAVPLVTIDPTSVMSSYLGSSAKNLRRIFAHAQTENCVVFFDEFDALAKSRDDAQDIGEAKRVVNSLLLELDRSGHALVVAATNYEQAIDPAVHRRFDLHIEFGLPGPSERCELIARHAALKSFGVSDPVTRLLALATDNWSHSDIERQLNTLSRAALLNFDGNLDDEGKADLMRGITQWGIERLADTTLDNDTRREIAKVAVEVMDYSHRQTAELLGVTHPTIGKWLKCESDATSVR